jgi:hypothetical protein
MKEDEVVEESPWPPSVASGKATHASDNHAKKSNAEEAVAEKWRVVANLATQAAAGSNKRPMRGPSLRLKTKRPAIYGGSDDDDDEDDLEGFGSSDDSECHSPRARKAQKGLKSTPNSKKNGRLTPRWKGEDMLRFPGYVSVCPASVREEEVTLEWMANGNFNKPYRLVGYSKERLLSYQKMNNVNYIRDQVGSHVEVRTIDVNTQNDGPKLSLYDWCEYWKYKTERKKKTSAGGGGLPDLTEEYAPRHAKRCLNVVSLSLANSPLEDELQAPGIVQDSDLVRLFWPEDCTTACPKPKAELYALMSPAQCYTDWHIDFGGSSVWYNVVRGSKYFALAPPSEHNLQAFAAWANSTKQEKVNLLVYLKDPVLYELKAGDTMIIPGGWPHAVYTPSDSIAVGGNFLHPFNLNLQLEIWKLEDAIGVPMSCRFPAFKSLMWYVAKNISSNKQQHLKLTVNHCNGMVNGGNGLKIKLPSSPLVKGLSSSKSTATKTARAVKLLLGQSACQNNDDSNDERRTKTKSSSSSSLRKLLLILNEWFESSNFTSVPLDISSPQEMLGELETLLQCEEGGTCLLFTDYAKCKLREPQYKPGLGEEPLQKGMHNQWVKSGNGLQSSSPFSNGHGYRSPQQQQQLSPLAMRMKLASSTFSNCLHTKKALGSSVKKVKKQERVRDRLKKKLGMRR